MVIRFAFLVAVGLAIAGACIFVLVRGFIVKQEEDSVQARARFVAQVVLASHIRPSDFRFVPQQRRVALDSLFRKQVLVDGVMRAALYAPSGRVTYSTSPEAIGRLTPDSAAARSAGKRTTIHSLLASKVIGGAREQVLEELVPIRFAGGRPSGTLVLWNNYGPIARSARDAFIPISLVLELLLAGLFVGLIPMLRRVTRQVRAHLAESERRAMHDDLTGLPNRTLFSERVRLALAECSSSGTGTALLLIDLDRFKEINDTLGHAAGDALLRELAGRLALVMRESDTVARLGGDEFGMILTGTGLEGACATASRVIELVEQPFIIGDLSLSIGASVGIALYPHHGLRAATLLKHADIAMYAAKRAGIGYGVYDPAANSHDADRLSLASELRQAIERDEILTYFQPMVDLRTGEIQGMEALLRWDHPTRGVLTAAQFMSVADQIGMVGVLSEHALLLAIQACVEWHSAGSAMTVAVNLDMRSLVDLGLPQRVSSLLEDHGLDPSWLEIEITEVSLMGDPVRVRRVATELAEIGIKLVIDDFAAGHTSLRYLGQLPISKVKIDRSLIVGIADAPRERTIVSGIIEIAHNLGMDVVAEGIEDETSLDLVRALDSDLAQGYLLGRPAAAPAITDGVIATAQRA